MAPSSRLPATLSLVAALLGLVFASYSTLDYAQHLDRGLHDIHCSVIPGAAPTSEAEACRAAMYSPYSALFKERLWGGVPISLFALGAFTFFAGFSLYLLLAGARAPRRAWTFHAVVSVTPLCVSLVMLVISLTKLGGVCKTCAGLYVSSTLLAVGGVLGALALRSDAANTVRRSVGPVLPVMWLAALGAATLVPSLVYANTAPDERPYLSTCGSLKRAAEERDGLLHIVTSSPRRKVTLFEDPLCPTCKAFHQRLLGEGVFEKLDIQLALFPLDSDCNWMLTEPLHPGACLVASAVICGKDRARDVLEWAYAEQEALSAAGKSSKDALRRLIEQRWGDGVAKCLDDRGTKATLGHHLHFATDNSIPVSTPQVYLGEKKICDEDTDLGLRFTLHELAPELLQ